MLRLPAFHPHINREEDGTSSVPLSAVLLYCLCLSSFAHVSRVTLIHRSKRITSLLAVFAPRCCLLLSVTAAAAAAAIDYQVLLTIIPGTAVVFCRGDKDTVRTYFAKVCSLP